MQRGKHCRKGNESVWVKEKSPEKSPNEIVPESKSHPFLKRVQQRCSRAPWPSIGRTGKTSTFRRWSGQRRKHRDFAVCVKSPISDTPVSSPAHTVTSLRTHTHTHTSTHTHTHQSSALTYRCTYSQRGRREEGRGEESEPTLFESLPASVIDRMCSVFGRGDRLSTNRLYLMNETKNQENYREISLISK